jgi:hypothetical protein
MQVNSYIFQSPYSSQVQIGRLDTSTNNKETSTQDDSALKNAVNQPLNNAQSFKATQTQEVKPTVDGGALLDTYA